MKLSDIALKLRSFGAMSFSRRRIICYSKYERSYFLRHRFASARLNRWLDEGANLNNKIMYLMVYMGHDRIDETAYYIHIMPEHLVKSAGIDWEALNSVIPEVSRWRQL